MKIRKGFISNSSSASFVLQTSNLTKEQMCAIDDKLEFKNKLGEYYKIYDLIIKDTQTPHFDYWRCFKYHKEIHGTTLMNNGYIEEWFRNLGISQSEYEILDDYLVDLDLEY